MKKITDGVYCHRQRRIKKLSSMKTRKVNKREGERGQGISIVLIY